ncbi:MAG: phosphoribosyltransferase family protein [bacterium]
MNEAIDILTKVGAILPNDHFVGTSGLHFDTYINKDFLYPHTMETSRICELCAEKYKDANIEVVVGPALGGIILSQLVASHLSKIYDREVLAVYTEKNTEGEQVFTRGYENYVKGRRVLVVEDIITTGGSISKTIKAVRDTGGNIIGACAMINKNEVLDKSMFGVPFDTLAELFIKTYEAKDCPLCEKGIPVNIKLGHGKKFLASYTPTQPPPTAGGGEEGVK